MATQGQRRREAIAAIREIRRVYRRADSAGEILERELGRLVKRQTLIGPDSLQSTGKMITNYANAVSQVEKAFATLYTIIKSIPV